MSSKPQDSDFEALGKSIAAGIEPTDDLHASSAYRKEVAAVLVARALRTALARAKESA